jgi:organic radical activating enzyme
MNKETFCSLPFTAIFLGPDTGIKPCCSSDTALGFLNQNTIQEILQNHRTHDLRQSIIEGKWHESCKQCQRQAEQGIRSERKDDLEMFLQQHGRDIDKNYFKLTRMDLRWSNTCNLSCTYCYEYFSSKWAEIKGIKVNSVVDENEQSLFLLVEQSQDSIENIMMLGGEPLLQKQNAYLIDLVSNKNIYVLTNLAVPLANNKVAQRLFKESNVHIGISFETVRDRYEYVRHGAQWELFDSNIDYIKSQRSVVSVDAHSLYSIYSAFNLVEFYEYIVSKNAFNQVFWNLLESSGENMHASVFKLSRPLKNDAMAEIDRVVERFPNAPGVSDLISIKSTLEQNVEMDPKDFGFIEEADRVELQLKKSSDKRFKDLWPELFDKLQNYNENTNSNKLV